jgi:hypothetical protein
MAITAGDPALPWSSPKPSTKNAWALEAIRNSVAPPIIALSCLFIV